jgi:hypothetical protein
MTNTYLHDNRMGIVILKTVTDQNPKRDEARNPQAKIER